ncbi:PKD domain-containing protein [Haloarculaceae archaeon H-GB2-1]|nr:PKD domain-containing protein [Haloarculaceae archaeon H-GB11]MEA5407400.1 PKD domain-containing protein [Haloarculaceae archaeon H-GB2-1]
MRLNVTSVHVTHTGGRSLPLDALSLTLEASNGGTYDLTANNVTGDGDDRFEPGEVFVRDHGLTDRTVHVVLTFESDTVLVNGIYDVGTPGEPLTPRAVIDVTTSDPVAGSTIHFDGSGSEAPNSITSYEWDFDDDGTTDATGEAPTHTYASSGTYDVTLTITTQSGQTDTSTRQLTVDAPTASASFDYSPSDPVGGETVTFSDDGSTAAAPITSYEWDFDDDGTTDATGESVTHSFADSGTYTVTLTITDADGNSDSTSAQVSVDNAAPSASFDYSPSNPVSGETVTFSDASSDPDGSIASAEWDFDDDGSTDATGSSVSHSFADDGTYPVTLTVTDDDGATATTTQQVQVDNAQPSASFSYSPSNPTTADAITFTDASTDDGTIVSAEWDFTNDGTTDATGGSVTHQYPDDGTYSVSLTVTDDDGATSSTTQQVQVDNLAPSPAFTTATISGGIRYDARRSSDADGSIVRYEWDVDGDNVYEVSTANPVHDYSTAFTTTGTVRLRVTDDDGATNVLAKSGELQPSPGFELFGAVLAVLLGGALRRRGYL